MITSKNVKTKAITKFVPATIQSTLSGVLHALSDVLSQEVVPPTTLAQVLFIARETAAALEKGIEKAAKTRLITLLKESGSQTTEKGQRELVVDGWKLQMRPYRTGYDPKKLEALIRARGKDPANYMSTKLTYEVSEDGCNKLVDKKLLTPDELETCRHDESWTVLTPTHEST